MMIGSDPPAGPPMQPAASKRQALVQRRYPGASVPSSIGSGDHLDGVYLPATVDGGGTEDVADQFVDRLVDAHVERMQPVRIIAVRPHERNGDRLGKRAVRANRNWPST